MQPRLIVLLGAVAAAALLPLAGAAAGPVGDRDAKSPLPSPAGAPAGTPAEGPADASRCGPELSSPDGVEAQTCVLTQDLETWARTYYRNVTGEELAAVLTMMGPGARTVRMHCAVGAGDEPGVCEKTPRERSAGETAAYSAVAEFAAGESGALLLRSGSNSGAPSGS
ncbi:Secreted protein OS=Streptomyces alboniger OX=132473 GN=CP975_17250 PE=4 SV=1 [Streptomyces alboniger]